MAFDRGTVRGAGHLLALLAACEAVVWTLQRPGSLILSFLALAATLAAIASLYRSIRRHDRELVRFIEAIGHVDLSQRFGGGAVGTALDAAMRRLCADRQRISEEARFHAAMIEETPVALLTVGQDRTINLLNAAARGLFGQLDGRSIEALASRSEALVVALDPTSARLGRSLIALSAAGGDHRAVVTITELRRAGRLLRLVSVEPIGRELDAAEVAAQADLVRVLTHEIMNSLTPVTSLARSAATLMARVPDGDEDSRDARRAIQIVADRAAGLLGFVDSYRQYATLPVAVRRTCDARVWADGVVALFSEASFARSVRVVVEVVPPKATFTADPDLLTQALLNLLKNAAEAGAGHVQLTIRGYEDHVNLVVADDGTGFGADVAADMFLPFFTSKSTGTGIGLSLTRQVAVAHGGSISAHKGNRGGAVFLMSIPR
jgi:two-component system nitrogen regulation sensor histidine kinase NtrY